MKFSLKPLVTTSSKVPRFIIGTFYCGEYMHNVSISSNKLSNLLKSLSSSVSADETRPLLRSDDLYTRLQKSSFARSINNADRQTSRAHSLGARKVVFCTTIILICGHRVCVHDSRGLILLFVLFLTLSFSYLLLVDATCDKLLATR